MGADPVARPQQLLGLVGVVGAEVELLGQGDGDVVQAVQEGEGLDRGLGGGDLGEGGAFDAVGGVDDGFGGVVGGVGLGGAEDQGGVVVEGVAFGDEAADAEPGGEWGDGGGAPVGLRGQGVNVDDSGEVRPGADQLGGFGGGEDGYRWREFLQGGPVTVVRKFMGDGYHVDVGRWGMRLSLLLSFSFGEYAIERGYALYTRWDSVVLSGEPTGNIRLRPCEPRVYEDVESRSAVWSLCTRRVWY